MNPPLRFAVLFTLTLAAVPPALSAQETAQESMTLDGFLSQVRGSNSAVQGAQESTAAGFARSQEGQLLTSPVLLANAQLASDQKPSSSPIFGYDKVISNTYSLGVGWQTRYGTQAKVSWNLNYFSYTNLTMLTGAGNVGIPQLSYNEARPAIELSQPLWSNGFGRATRATQEMAEAQALASAYGARFTAKALLVEAETAYWRLALARQAVSVQQDALDRASKLLDWSNRRVKLQLADEADSLQAKALVEVRQLELQNALNEEREAARAFNSARNIDSDAVSETLVDFAPETAAAAAPPPRSGLRDDVRAAEQAQRLTAANAKAAQEKDKPTLDLYASYALNGQKPSPGEALGEAFSSGRPTQAIGLRFSMPLDWGTLNESRRAWAREQAAAELNLRKKLADEETSWKSLNQRFEDAKHRFKLVRSLEFAQKAKLNREQARLRNGRTVTYQVLLFEQDYLLAQLSRIRSQSEILMLAAQLHLFDDSQGKTQ